jgi:predicted transposase/invertase (TIGR01784 family)
MTKQLVRFDWAMKRLLRSKANFGILEGFLSELLKRDVKILSLLESESNKNDKDGKYNKVDILVELDSKEIVLIEVQVNTESDYFYRMLFGTSKIVTEHLKEGEAYSQIKKVYSVNILYFDLGHGSDYVYYGTTSFTGLHNHDKLDLNKKQKQLYQKEYIHQIYPEYYLIKVNQFNDIAKDTLDEWIYFLKNEEIKESFHAKGLLEAKEKLNSLKLTDPEKQEYKKYLENLTYQKSMVVSSYDSGRIEGKTEGKAEVAKRMKAAGMTNEVIQQLTGLSVEEIDKT